MYHSQIECCLKPYSHCHLATRKGMFNDSVNSRQASAGEHDAMIALVEEMSPLFRGDLRAKATATTDTSEALANTFNHAISELRWLVETMETSSDRLKKTIEGSHESAGNVSVACAEQSRQIHKSSNYLFSMSATMSGLSADAAESSLAAQSAVDHAEFGADALRASLHTLSAIRDEADSTTRVMHRLADNVDAIDERISVIEDVARQTDLLALNTTIRASAGSRAATATSTAADLGRLSDEVAQLADVLGQATRDIGSLTRNIAEDASDTVQSMEHIAAELATGVIQTQHASDGLDIIQSSSRALHERVLLMTERCVEQTGIVRQLTEHMDQINQITDQTVEAVTLNSESLGELKAVAKELRLRTLDFRLPGKIAPEDEEKTHTFNRAKRAAERAVNS